MSVQGGSRCENICSFMLLPCQTGKWRHKTTVVAAAAAVHSNRPTGTFSEPG